MQAVYASGCQRLRKSTMQGDRREARSIESAYRTKLAKSEAGIEAKKTVPEFNAAMKDFLEWSKHEHAAHPATYLLSLMLAQVQALPARRRQGTYF